MPKAASKKARRSATRSSTAARAKERISSEVAVGVERSSSTQPAGSRRASGANYQALVMPALVALGCWGLAISFAFFSSDPNRLIWAGMAAVMGLIWSFSFWLRLRKIQQ